MKTYKDGFIEGVKVVVVYLAAYVTLLVAYMAFLAASGYSAQQSADVINSQVRPTLRIVAFLSNIALVSYAVSKKKANYFWILAAFIVGPLIVPFIYGDAVSRQSKKLASK